MSEHNDSIEMFAACPHCHAVFRLTREKLNFKDGLVRCGACREIFNANWNRVEKIGEGFAALDSDKVVKELEAELASLSEFERQNPSPKEYTVEPDSGQAEKQEVFEKFLEYEEQNLFGQKDANSLEPVKEIEDFSAFEDSQKYTEPETEPEHVDLEQDLAIDLVSPKAHITWEHLGELDTEFSDNPWAEYENKSNEPESEQTDSDSQSSDEVSDSELHFNINATDSEKVIDPFIDRSDAGDMDILNLKELDQKLGDEHSQPSINMNGVDHIISERTNPLVSLIWFVVAASFLFLLGLQVKYFFVERYAQDERYRPYLSAFCKVAQCQLPARQDLFRFTLTNTKIDLHPSEPGALRVTVKLVNEAGFDQPYPNLQLTLTDRVGRVVGRRTFSPDFYLTDNQQTLLEAGQLGSVWFDLAHPHEKAVGFVIDIVTTPGTIEARSA